MTEAEANNDITILDYLNEDCWGAVLKYVPERDLIRTERTSRQWQAHVLNYLKGARLRIYDSEYDRAKTNLRLSQRRYKSFARWTQKLGSSVVATYCYSLQTLKIVKENCPNLEHLTFTNYVTSFGDEEGLLYNLSKDFKCLKGLSFYSCCVSQKWIRLFVADKALEELEFTQCKKLEGDFLNKLKLSNLKSLTLHLKPYDEYFDVDDFLLEVKHLGALTKLALTVNNRPYSRYDAENKIQFFLDKMPKLEYLEINNNNSQIPMVCKDYIPLSRLTRLRHLQVALRLSDEAVDCVLRQCKNLRTLAFSDCSAMTELSLVSICRWGTQLRSLSLDDFKDLIVEDVVVIIRSCPELMILELVGAGASLGVPHLFERASAARQAVRPGVRLQLKIDLLFMLDGPLARPVSKKVKNQYENLDLKFH